MADHQDSLSFHSIDALRAAVCAGQAANDTQFADGVYFSWDTEGGDAQIAYESPDWAVLSVDWRVTGSPTWLSLNVSMGGGVLNDGDVIVLTAEGYADSPVSLPVVLRCDIAGEMLDVGLEDALEFNPVNGVCTAMRTIDPVDGIGGKHGFHTLIMHLPMQDMTMTLRNLRLSIVPAAQGLRSSPVTLSSLAN